MGSCSKRVRNCRELTDHRRSAGGRQLVPPFVHAHAALGNIGTALSA